MSSTQSTQHIAMVNTHMKLRAQLLAALDEAISEVGHEHVARALIDKDICYLCGYNDTGCKEASND